MASRGRTVTDPTHLNGGDGTMRVSLELWSAMNDPPQYQQWQSVYFGLMRDHGIVDTEAVENESSSDVQRRIRALYDEIQFDAHGPEYRALAVQRNIRVGMRS